MYAAIVRFLTNERIPLLVLGCVLWGAAALLNGPGARIYRQATTVGQSVAQYDSLLAVAGGHVVLREQLAETNDSLQSMLERLSGGMARASDLSGLLESLIGKAKGCGIPFVGVKPQTSEQSDGACPVLLEFACTYTALGKFVAALESQPHLTRVERLAVSAHDSRSVDVKLLVTVFLKEDEDVR